MKRNYYKMLIVMFCVVICSSLFIGCSNKGGNQNETNTPLTETATNPSTNTPDDSNTSGENSESGLLAEPGTATLSFGTSEMYPSPYNYSNNLPVYQEIEKRTGVTIKWEESPSDQYANAMNLRIASGAKNLPDIFNIPSGANALDLGTSGIILPLEDLIEQHAPNMKKLFSEHPEVKSMMTSPEGHIYSIPVVLLGTRAANPYVTFLRQDWLDNLGLQQPETPDDFYKILKAFKEQDANGNGDVNDEIPFTLQLPTSRLLKLGEPWGIKSTYSQGFSVDSNNKVQYDYIGPRMKELLVWLNKLYSEGLIDNEYTTNSAEVWNAKVNSNKIGSAIFFLANLPALDASLAKAGFEGAKHVGMLPLKGPYGDQILEVAGIVSGGYAISSATENAELAIKWLDYIWASEEGMTLMQYGIEGKSYVVENGEIKYTDYVLNNPDGLGAMQAVRYLGGYPSLPHITTLESALALNENNPDVIQRAKEIEPYLVQSFPTVIATMEESEVLAGVMPDLQTYLEEMITKFIVGQENLDNFDQFVQQIKNIGIDKVLEVKQTQWDRYNK